MDAPLSRGPGCGCATSRRAFASGLPGAATVATDALSCAVGQEARVQAHRAQAHQSQSRGPQEGVQAGPEAAAWRATGHA